MKTVFKSSELAHVWANESAPSGRCPSSMSFQGDAFYSYSTVIARRIRHKGKVAYLLDNATFSSTTSQHQGAVRHAIRDAEKVFGVYAHRYNQSLDWSPAEIRDHYIGNYKTIKGKTSRYAFKRADYLLDAYSNLEKAIEVCEFFGLATSKLYILRTSLAASLHEAKALVESRNEIKRLAREKRDQKKREERARTYAEQLPLWLAGEANYLPYGDFPVQLRAKDGNLETTRGAIVPLSDAERTFRFAVAVRARGWHSNGDKHQVGMYSLDAVNEQGVVAGCHRIAWDEIERFAKLQGWM